MSTSVSPQLHALLEENLDTFEKLEIVLALYAAQKPQTLSELALELQVGREALRRVTRELVASGMIETCEEDSLRLQSGAWDPLLDEAVRVYTDDPKHLMRVLTRIGMKKIGSLSARTFADAFRFRKKEGK